MKERSNIHLPNASPRYRTSASNGGAQSPRGTSSSAHPIAQTHRPPTQLHGAPQTATSPDSRFDAPQRDAVTVSDRPARRGVSRPRYWLAGSSIVMGLMLMVDLGSLRQPAAESSICQAVVQAETFLSREQLTNLMAIPERDSKAAVKQVLGEPYCQLSPMEVRAGVQAEREAYPLAFDPDAWVIVLYEGEEYAGYDFKFPGQ